MAVGRYRRFIPSGGSSGQVLKKSSGTDYDVAWSNSSVGLSADYEAALGTYTAETPYGDPGMVAVGVDPGDGGWIDTILSANEATWTWGKGQDADLYALVSAGFGTSMVRLNSGPGGPQIDARVTADDTQILLTMQPDQTQSPFIVRDSDGVPIFDVRPGGSSEPADGTHGAVIAQWDVGATSNEFGIVAEAHPPNDLSGTDHTAKFLADVYADNNHTSDYALAELFVLGRSAWMVQANATSTVQTMTMAAAQSASPFVIKDSDGNAVHEFQPGGDLYVGRGGTGRGQVDIYGYANTAAVSLYVDDAGDALLEVTNTHSTLAVDMPAGQTTKPISVSLAGAGAKFCVTPAGAIGVGNSASATTIASPGSVTKKIQVFAADGTTSLGYIPVYAAIT